MIKESHYGDELSRCSMSLDSCPLHVGNTSNGVCVLFFLGARPGLEWFLSTGFRCTWMLYRLVGVGQYQPELSRRTPWLAVLTNS